MANTLEDLVGELVQKAAEAVDLLRDLRGASEEEKERAVQSEASSSGGSGGAGGARGAAGAFAKEALGLGVSLTDNQTAGTAGAIGLARSGLQIAGGVAGGVLGSALGPAGTVAGAAAGTAAGTAIGNLAGLTASQRVENSAFANTRDIARRFAAAGGEVTPEIARGLGQGFRETARRLEKADDVVSGYFKSAQGFQDAASSAVGGDSGLLKSLDDRARRTNELLERIARGGG